MLDQLKFNQNEVSFAVLSLKQENIRESSGTNFLSMIKDNLYNQDKKAVPANDLMSNKVRDDRLPVKDETSARPKEVKSEKLKFIENEKTSTTTDKNEETKEVKNSAQEAVHLKNKENSDNIDSDWDKIEQSLLEDDLIVSLLGKEGIKELVKAMKASLENGSKPFLDNPALENVLKKLEAISLKNKEQLSGFNELTADEKEKFKKVFFEFKNLLNKSNQGKAHLFLKEESHDSGAVKVSIKDLQKFMENLVSFADSKKVGRAGKYENKNIPSVDKNSTASSGELPVLNKVTISPEKGTDEKFNDGKENKDFFALSSGKTVQADKITNDKQSMHGKMPEFKQSLQDIMDKARITVKDSKNGKFNVKLYPKELGNVNVSLNLESGVVHGRFIVDNDEAKNLLMQNLNYLRETLKESGIEVGDFSVNVSDKQEQFVGDDSKDDKKKLYESTVDKVLVSGEYEVNSASIHKGQINLII